MMKIFADTRFLLVDDQEIYRKENLQKLVEIGFEAEAVDTAINGLEALEKAENDDSDYEFFIVDLVMPKMNGIELITKLNSIPKYKNTPKLVVSGSFDRSIVLEVSKAGASSFVVKPAEEKVLAEKIISCFQKKLLSGLD